MELSNTTTALEPICIGCFDWRRNLPLAKTRIALWTSIARCGAESDHDIDIAGAWITPDLTQHDYLYGIRAVPRQGRCKLNRRLCEACGEQLCECY